MVTLIYIEKKIVKTIEWKDRDLTLNGQKYERVDNPTGNPG